MLPSVRTEPRTARFMRLRHISYTKPESLEPLESGTHEQVVQREQAVQHIQYNILPLHLCHRPTRIVILNHT